MSSLKKQKIDTSFSAFCYAFERYGGEMRKFDKVYRRASASITVAVGKLKAKEFPGQNVTETQEKDIYQRAIKKILSMDEGLERGQVTEDFRKLSLEM